MKIVVGLGNPGKAYDRTPHNIGFDVVDRLAERYECKSRRMLRFNARVAKAKIEGEDTFLVKPQTFMNLSGQAVAPLARYYKIAPEDVIVVVDDADLPARCLRIRPDGGSGGHRGLQSIMDNLGNRGFPRLRVGIGRREEDKTLTRHVLSKFNAAEYKAMQVVIDRAADAVMSLLTSGISAAMNEFNGQVENEAGAGPDS